MTLLFVLIVLAVVVAIAGWVSERARRTAYPLPPLAGPPIASFATSLTDPVGIAQAGSLSIGFAAFLMVSGGGLILAMAVVPERLFERAALGLLVLAAVAAPLAARAARRMRDRPPPEIAIHADRITMPSVARHGLWLEAETHALAAVRSIHASDDALNMNLPYGSRGISRAVLTPPEDFDRLVAALGQALAHLPHAEEIRVRSERELEETRRLAGRTAWVATGLPWALSAVFGLEVVLGLYSDAAATLVRMGGLSRVLVERGEWERIFVANYIHAGLIHLLFNVGFIGLFAPLIERLVGSWRLLAVILVSGPLGMLAATLADPLVVGSSTWAFGLLVAMGLIEYRHGARLPPAFQLRSENWITLALVNAALPLLVRQISWAGHLGGLVGGALVARLIAWREDAFERSRSAPLIATVVLLCALHGASVLLVALRAH